MYIRMYLAQYSLQYVCHSLSGSRTYMWLLFITERVFAFLLSTFTTSGRPLSICLCARQLPSTWHVVTHSHTPHVTCSDTLTYTTCKFILPLAAQSVRLACALRSCMPITMVQQGNYTKDKVLFAVLQMMCPLLCPTSVSFIGRLFVLELRTCTYVLLSWKQWLYARNVPTQNDATILLRALLALLTLFQQLCT